MIRWRLNWCAHQGAGRRESAGSFRRALWLNRAGVTWLSRVHHGALLWTSLIVQKCGGLHFTHSQYLKCFFFSRVSAIGNSMGNSVKLHLKSKDPAAFGLLWDVFPPVIQRSLRDFMDILPLFCGWNPGGLLHLRSHHILWDSLQLYRLSDLGLRDSKTARDMTGRWSLRPFWWELQPKKFHFKYDSQHHTKEMSRWHELGTCACTVHSVYYFQ